MNEQRTGYLPRTVQMEILPPANQVGDRHRYCQAAKGPKAQMSVQPDFLTCAMNVPGDYPQTPPDRVLD